MALALALLLTAACNGSALSKNSTLVEANQTRSAFFHRPVALAAAQASAVPHPLIVMLSSDPWLTVIGSDSPALALYSDGTVIFRTHIGFESTKLDQNQLRAVDI